MYAIRSYYGISGGLPPSAPPSTPLSRRESRPPTGTAPERPLPLLPAETAPRKPLPSSCVITSYSIHYTKLYEDHPRRGLRVRSEGEGHQVLRPGHGAAHRAAAVLGKAAMTPPSHGFADNEKWLGRVMIAPAIVYIVALVGFPFFLALFYSVSNITVGSIV